MRFTHPHPFIESFLSGLSIFRWNTFPRLREITALDHLIFVAHIAILIASVREEREGYRYNISLLLRKILFSGFFTFVYSDISSDVKERLRNTDPAIFEALEGKPEWHTLDIRVLPGITAMLAAAARIGAPLGHDFCAINLSDNLKPWARVEQRLRAAAQADFAMALYNPRSAGRPHQFARTLDILLDVCGPQRLITFARAVMTPDEHIETLALAQATPEMADMRTVVLVGSSTTRRVGPWVYTPRRSE